MSADPAKTQAALNDSAHALRIYDAKDFSEYGELLDIVFWAELVRVMREVLSEDP